MCKAQVLTFVERVNEHSVIIKVDGVEYRAFDDVKMKELEGRKAELDICQKQYTVAKDEIAALTAENQALNDKASVIELQRDNAKRDLQDARVLISQQRELLNQETQLRKDSQQLIPHGNVGGFGGKVLKFLDSSWGQATFKLFIPTAQAGKVFFGRCEAR